tara:strand:- start:26 stop:637 length:612 start_codon:yes stop_codon:yes gene_type:complete
MDINKDTIVSKIGPFNTKIKLGFLVKIVSELIYEKLNLDEIYKSLMDEEVDYRFEFSEGFLLEAYGKVELGIMDNFGSESIIKILEKVFKEEFYYMRSDNFYWDAEVEDPELKNFMKKEFVNTNIESIDKNILIETTKDHSYSNVGEIDKNNFLTNDEIILFDSLCENDKAEQCYSNYFQYYYIRKKDFNKEKWWLGWTGEDE